MGPKQAGISREAMRGKSREKKKLVQIGFLKEPNKEKMSDMKKLEVIGILTENMEEKLMKSRNIVPQKIRTVKRRDRGKSDKMKSKGENKRFHEKVQYQERHFKDN